MSQLNIELSKSYINNTDELKIIIGEVSENTFEYEEGYRFYDSDGIIYKENGESSDTLVLIREATADQLTNLGGEKLRLLVDSTDSDNKFIPTSSPIFKIEEGGTYINRMGFTVEDDMIVDYFPNGSYMDVIPSMYDILYRLIRYDEKERFFIHIGKTYKTRNGEAAITIVGFEDSKSKLYRPTHPFIGDDGEVYTPSGHFNENIDCEYDLVELIA